MSNKLDQKLPGLVAVASALIFGMTWGVSGSGWVAAGLVATYWQACFVAWRWRGKRGNHKGQ